jgi:hypothetical protein
MPLYQDPGHYGQHAFPAFTHLFAFCSFQPSSSLRTRAYLKTSHSDRESQMKVRVGRNEAEEAVEAVVVTATMPSCRLAQGGSAAGFLS